MGVTTLARSEVVKGVGLLNPPHGPGLGLVGHGGDMMNVFVPFTFLVFVLVDFLTHRVSVAVVMKTVVLVKDKDVLSLRATRCGCEGSIGSTVSGVSHQQASYTHSKSSP